MIYGSKASKIFKHGAAYFSAIKKCTKTQNIINTKYSECLTCNTYSYKSLITKNNYNFCQKKNSENITQQFKEQSKQFYESQVEAIIQLKNAQQWTSVVSRIREPIIIDLYADWCGPCKKLTPKLQKRVKQFEKQKKDVKLIKINIDKCPQLAQALQVKSVPTVYLVYLGNAIDGFQGDVPDQQLDKFFENIEKITNTSAAQKQGILFLQDSKLLVQEGKYQQAITKLQQFKDKQNREDLVAIKHIFLTQCYLSAGQIGKFKESVIKCEMYQHYYKQNPDMYKFFEIMKEQFKKIEEQIKRDPQIQALQDQLAPLNAISPQNKQQRLNLKFKLVQLYRQKNMPSQSLQTAMEIIKQDKNWQDKKTNKLVLQIFKELGGNKSIIVQDYRKKLQRLIS